MVILKTTLVLTVLAVLSESANILSFTTLPAYSHYVIVDPIIKGLAERGHNITAVTYFPQKTQIKNIHDIDVSHSQPLVSGKITMDYVLKNWGKITGMIDFIIGLSYQNCEAVLKDKAVQELIKNDGNKFDLVINEVFGADCFSGFAYKYKAPLVSVVTTISFPWIHKRIGNPDNPAYIPTYFSKITDGMTFYDRLINTINFAYSYIAYPFYSELPNHKLIEESFGEPFPPIQEILKNTSLVLINSHLSYKPIQPVLPNYIDIGGIHLKEPKPLPKDVQEILDRSTKGAILVSLGSVIRTSTLPKEILGAFINTFRKLPYQIIWKVEDEIAGLPPNVITRKWFPIQDSLDHPNIKVIVMHGGMATTIETVNAGVPAVGIPLFADQTANINGLANRGAAIQVNYEDITEEILFNAIYKVANDRSYRENMQRLSALFRDRPSTPLQTAIYWIEYVLRHKGAAHLQSSATDLSWYQIMLLDIIAVFLIAILSVITLLYVTIKTLKRIVFPGKPLSQKKKRS